MQMPPVIPVAVIDNADDAVPLANALAAGGLPIVEVTFRTDAAEESIRRIRAEAPDVLAAAGTVVTPRQADAALRAGVQIGLAPGCNPTTVKRFQEAGVPFLPGIATPSQIEAAYELGCRRMKFFPAATMGGVAGFKAITAPYAYLGIEFNPTGGITLETLPDFLSLPQVVAVGGSWIATRDDIRENRWEEITKKAAAAVAAASAVG